MEIAIGAAVVLIASLGYGVYRRFRSGPERPGLAHVMAPVRPRPGSRSAAVALDEPDED